MSCRTRLGTWLDNRPDDSAHMPSRIYAATKFAAYVLNHPANAAHPWRRLGSAAYFQASGRLAKRRRVVPIGTRSRMWADVHHGSSVKVASANPPDWNEMLAWRKLVQPGDLFIDVGANVGAYTLWIADLGARPVAIEPDPTARALLSENLALNGYSVEVLAVALAAEPGIMRLTSGLDGANHLVTSGKGPFGSANDQFPSQDVRVETLDRILGNRMAAGVKIDVEGAELLVLEGARQALQQRRIACLQLEWNAMSGHVLGHTRQSTAEFLTSLGYELFRPDRYGTLHPLRDGGTYGADIFAKPVA